MTSDVPPKSYRTARQVALSAYLDAFDTWLTTPSALNLQTLDVARSAWVLEIAIDEAQQRLAV